jgi:putative selenium metabolism hydrolase
MVATDIWNLAKAHRDALVTFAQKLVQTPSLSGQEGQVAALVEAEMRRLAYDEVWMDEVGNGIGRIPGGRGPSLMFNAHMDVVDAGDPDRWPHPPLGGEVHDGALWGRGAADMKGALAAMVYAGGLLRAMGSTPPGDVYVTAVVQEEVGGLGARHLARTLPVDRAIVGEASANQLRRGHRGRMELVAHFEGRSVHASMPDLGVNPHYSLICFVEMLRSLEMATDPDYGASTVAPTRVSSQPSSANVTPGEIQLVLDWRNIPSEGPEEALSKLEAALARSLEPGCQGRVELATKNLSTYTGFQMAFPDTFPSFTTSTGHPWLARAQATLASALGRAVEVDVWRFATDGGHFAAAGTTVLGFGPGDDTLVHTVEERIPIEDLVENAVGCVALALDKG